jgi:hypothetical protein
VTEAPDPVTFTFVNSTTDLEDPVGTILARIKPRISAAVNSDRLLDVYTQKPTDEDWLFVVLGDVDPSKSRTQQTDAIDYRPVNSNYSQTLLHRFTVFVFSTVTSEIAAANARDKAEDLLRPIMRSVLGKKFGTGLAQDIQSPVHFVGHRPTGYTTAVYIHEYSFESAAVVGFEDTVGPNIDVAFRDISYTMDPDLGGTTTATGTIDLDDTPL